MTEISLASIENRVIDVVAKTLRIDRAQLGTQTNLINDVNADSLDALNIVLEIEEVFKVIIPDEELHNYQTIGDIVVAVQERVNSRVQNPG